jgi:hypothetical protein
LVAQIVQASLLAAVAAAAAAADAETSDLKKELTTGTFSSLLMLPLAHFFRGRFTAK